MLHARADYQGRIIDKAGLIPDDEPVFMLRARDMLAPALVILWSEQLRAAGGDPAMADLAFKHASAMRRWQATHGGPKLPDLPTPAA